MTVNPAPGALVRDPATGLAIADRTEIDPTDPYWGRLLADGDIGPYTATAPVVASRRQAASSEDAS